MNSYYGRPLPDLYGLDITKCYICSKELEGKIDNDHIIPQKIFGPESQHRPYLRVHHRCNNTKSLLDRKFALRVALASSLNSKIAKAEFDKFLAKVTVERERAYLVGHSKSIPNYKLSKTISKGMTKVMELSPAEYEVKMGDEHVADQQNYASTMTRGLFIRNVKGVWPTVPNLYWLDYQLLYRQGKLAKRLESIDRAMKSALQSPGGFGQLWPRRIYYAGTSFSGRELQGFLYIEFYNSLGIMAEFPSP